MVNLSQRGFTFVALLATLAIFSFGSVVFARYWSEATRRDREAEWLRIGSTYAAAIADYYNASPGPERAFPRRLEDLLADPRFVGTRRHLRDLYGDPMSRGSDWNLVRSVDGGIMGVRSTSTAAPLRQNDFGPWGTGRRSTTSYSEVEFRFDPSSEGKR